VEVLDETGRRLARARLDEGVAGMARLHELLAEHLDQDSVDAETGALAEGAVIVGIETDRGPWVSALVAAGYQVYAINPMSVARYRERHSTSGAKSDPGDAHVLAEIVRLDRTHHRPVAGDSDQADALKLVARSHQSLIWERSRHLQRLRQVLREYFPGLLDALSAGRLELADPDALELIERPRGPAAGHAVVPVEDRCGAHAGPASRRRGAGGGDPGCAAGAGVGSARRGRGRLRHHRRLAGEVDFDAQRPDPGVGGGGGAGFFPAPGR
jgi:hypothetical protein